MKAGAFKAPQRKEVTPGARVLPTHGSLTTNRDDLLSSYGTVEGREGRGRPRMPTRATTSAGNSVDQERALARARALGLNRAPKEVPPPTRSPESSRSRSRSPPPPSRLRRNASESTPSHSRRYSSDESEEERAPRPKPPPRHHTLSPGTATAASASGSAAPHAGGAEPAAPATLFGSLWGKAAAALGGAAPAPAPAGAAASLATSASGAKSAENNAPLPTNASPAKLSKSVQEIGPDPLVKKQELGVPDAKITPFILDPDAPTTSSPPSPPPPQQSSLANTRPLSLSSSTKRTSVDLFAHTTTPKPKGTFAGPVPLVEPITWHRPPPVHPRDHSVLARPVPRGARRTPYDWLEPQDHNMAVDAFLFHRQAGRAATRKPRQRPGGPPSGPGKDHSGLYTKSSLAHGASHQPPPPPVPTIDPHAMAMALYAQQRAEYEAQMAQYQAAVVFQRRQQQQLQQQQHLLAVSQAPPPPHHLVPTPHATPPVFTSYGAIPHASPPPPAPHPVYSSPQPSLAAQAFYSPALGPAFSTPATTISSPQPPLTQFAPPQPHPTPVYPHPLAATPAPTHHSPPIVLPTPPIPPTSAPPPSSAVLPNGAPTTLTASPMPIELPKMPVPPSSPMPAGMEDVVVPAVAATTSSGILGRRKEVARRGRGSRIMGEEELEKALPKEPSIGKEEEEEEMVEETRLNIKLPTLPMLSFGGEEKAKDGVVEEATTVAKEGVEGQSPTSASNNGDETSEDEEEEEEAPTLPTVLPELEWSLPDFGLGGLSLAGDNDTISSPIIAPASFFSSLGGIFPSSEAEKVPVEEGEELPFPEKSEEVLREELEALQEEEEEEDDGEGSLDLAFAAMDSLGGFSLPPVLDSNHDDRLAKWMEQQGVTLAKREELEAMKKARDQEAKGEDDHESVGSTDQNVGFEEEKKDAVAPLSFSKPKAPESLAPPPAPLLRPRTAPPASVASSTISLSPSMVPSLPPSSLSTSLITTFSRSARFARPPSRVLHPLAAAHTFTPRDLTADEEENNTAPSPTNAAFDDDVRGGGEGTLGRKRAVGKTSEHGRVVLGGSLWDDKDVIAEAVEEEEQKKVVVAVEEQKVERKSTRPLPIPPTVPTPATSVAIAALSNAAFAQGTTTTAAAGDGKSEWARGLGELPKPTVSSLKQVEDEFFSGW